jgi:hypothetical protein
MKKKGSGNEKDGPQPVSDLDSAFLEKITRCAGFLLRAVAPRYRRGTA